MFAQFDSVKSYTKEIEHSTTIPSSTIKGVMYRYKNYNTQKKSPLKLKRISHFPDNFAASKKIISEATICNLQVIVYTYMYLEGEYYGKFPSLHEVIVYGFYPKNI